MTTLHAVSISAWLSISSRKASAMKKTALIAAALCLFVATLAAQQRRFEVHSRGMLRQTVYNTGELGRAYDQGTAGVLEGVPSLEWPANSAVTIDSKFYSGQHNSFGGGVQLSLERRNTSRSSRSWVCTVFRFL